MGRLWVPVDDFKGGKSQSLDEEMLVDQTIRLAGVVCVERRQRFEVSIYLGFREYVREDAEICAEAHKTVKVHLGVRIRVKLEVRKH